MLYNQIGVQLPLLSRSIWTSWNSASMKKSILFSFTGSWNHHQNSGDSFWETFAYLDVKQKILRLNVKISPKWRQSARKWGNEKTRKFTEAIDSWFVDYLKYPLWISIPSKFQNFPFDGKTMRLYITVISENPVFFIQPII